MVELLVAMMIFGIITTAFYSILFSATDSAETTRAVVGTSNEARRGFNRLLRDTRESQDIFNASFDTFTVENDFDGNGTIEPVPTGEFGSYERLTFRFVENPDPTLTGAVLVGNGFVEEVLIDGVECVRDGIGDCYPVFSYSSNDLTYDADGNGVSSALEIDGYPVVGDGNGVLNLPSELRVVDTVSFMMQITIGGHSERFYGAAQMRNAR